MTKFFTVIPVIDADLAATCVESILRPDSAAGLDPGDIMLVDNTRKGLSTSWGLQWHRDLGNHNLGVARSWNVGIRHALRYNYDYVVLMSQTMLFGPMKECTLMSEMLNAMPAKTIETYGHSWHLIAFHRSIFEEIGLFDENFYPGYFEAIDFGLRMALRGLEGWPRIWCNVLSRTVASHAYLGLAPPLLDYYRWKWGGNKGEETFTLPWGDKPIDYFPEYSIPELAKRYGLKEWW